MDCGTWSPVHRVTCIRNAGHPGLHFDRGYRCAWEGGEPSKGAARREGVFLDDGTWLDSNWVQILKDLAQGLSVTQMAESAQVSREAMRSRKQRLYRAIGVHSEKEALAWAFRNGVVQ